MRKLFKPMRPLKLLIYYCCLTVALVICSSVSNLLFAQANLGKSIQIDTTQCSVRQLFNQLKTAQNLRLAYSESYLNVQRTVTLTTTTPTLAELLDAISRATGTTYEVRGDQIIFRKKNAKFTISGYIRNAHSGEDLIGASIWRCSSSTPDSSIAQAMLGTSSNNYGFYSLTLPAADSVRLRCSYVGLTAQATAISLYQDTVINWNLSDTMLAEVMVTSSATLSLNPISLDLPIAPRFLLSTPFLLGEADVLKGLQRLPGVQSGVDGSSELYVLGSSPDQNLVLLDGVPVYSATHLYGFFSVFNADAINHIDFYKSGFPARYGERLASVVDVKLKEGNREKFQGAGSVGILSSRLMLEGPLFNEKTSFLLSGRYGHPGLITRFVNVLGGSDRFVYGFHDITAKVNHTFSHRDQIYLSAYSGRDRLSNDYYYEIPPNTLNEKRDEAAQEKTWWGNVTTALRWNHIFNRRLFSNLTLTRSRYRFRLDENETVETSRSGQVLQVNRYEKERTSGISDWAAKLDFDFLPNPQNHLRFGGGITRHQFQPNTINLSYQVDAQVLVDTTYGSRIEYGTEANVYVENEMQWTSSISANLGFRMSGFWVDGASFFRGQPRLSLHYQPSPLTTWHASYTRMAQFMHLVTNPIISSPTDQWLPSSQYLPPETAQQWTVGYQRKLGDFYTIQTEGYYKDMRGVVEFRDGGFDLFEEVIDSENRIASGQGRAYGAEVLVQRNSERLTSWLGYTWSRSERQFDDINQGNWFPFRYDRRHEIDFGGVFHWKENIDLSWGWGLTSGFALTLPTVTFTEVVPALGSDSHNERIRTVAGARNSHRTRATHRLDVSISFHKEKRWGERTWEFGLYNVYNRQNPLMINFYNSNWNENTSYRFWQTSLLPILPMASYRFKF